MVHGRRCASTADLPQRVLTPQSLAAVADQRPVSAPVLAPLPRRILGFAATGLSIADIVGAASDAMPVEAAAVDRLRAVVRSVPAVTAPPRLLVWLRSTGSSTHGQPGEAQG